MIKPDILWIVVDSVRSYRSGIDDRDRIEILDTLSNEGVEFTNAFSSGPSSVLSGSSMFTGLNSCFISRHFNDWDFEENGIDSIFNLLKKNNYEIYSIFNSREERRILQNLIRPISNKYFPKGVSHKNWWTNKECTDIFINALDKHPKEKPAFFTIWYDCRKDKNTSKEVERALEYYRKSGRDSNSIVILCSDHGYPDPNSGLTEQTMRKYSHDMVITNDNIKVPLVIKYPGCPKGKKINDMVGSFEIFPTITELLNLATPNKNFNFKAHSILPLIYDKKRKDVVIRSDTRLNYAEGRVTALMKNEYKYVYYWDAKIEELYNLEKDPFEVNNLLNSENNKNESDIFLFRKVLKEMEDEINSFHIKNLTDNLNNGLNVKKINLNKDVLLVAKHAPKQLLESFISSIKTNNPKYAIDLLCSEKIYSYVKNLGFNSVKLIGDDNISEKEYSVVFYLTENSKSGHLDKDLLKRLKKMYNSKIIMLDYNFKIYNNFLSKWIFPLYNYFSSNKRFYYDDPSFLITDLIGVAGKGLSRIFGRRKGLPIDGNKVKKMRDREIKANLTK